MSESDSLRAELTKRGVKWEADGPRTWFYASGVEWLADETGSGLMLTAARLDDGIQRLTATQAIAATLGRGTCKEVKIDRYFRGCSECGYRWEHMYAVGWQVGPKFCPNCGCEVSRDEQ